MTWREWATLLALVAMTLMLADGLVAWGGGATTGPPPRSCWPSSFGSAWRFEAMFVGMYDPDKVKSVREKVREATDRYREKCHQYGEPETVLMNPRDAEALSKPPAGLTVKAVGDIPRHTYYVGREDSDAVRPE